MRYEYDPDKSRTNKVRHGIDFEEAKALWDDLRAVTAETRNDTEPRFLVVGRIHGVFWTAIVTCRGDAVRIISVRRSRKIEEIRYDEINNGGRA